MDGQDSRVEIEIVKPEFHTFEETQTGSKMRKMKVGLWHPKCTGTIKLSRLTHPQEGSAKARPFFTLRLRNLLDLLSLISYYKRQCGG